MDLATLNQVYPYVGRDEILRMDDKNRITIPQRFCRVRELRKKALGLEDDIFYYGMGKESDVDFLVLRDHFLGKEDLSSFYPGFFDNQSRITLDKAVVAAMPERKDLIFVGYGDHIRMYTQKDWQRVQSTE